MLHIHHADDPDRAPSKTYADACWIANPRLSSTWWREALGHTVGKLALDWRHAITNPEHLAAGCNLILASPRTWPAVTALLNLQPEPAAFITVFVTSSPSELPNPYPTFMLWQAPDDLPAASRHKALTLLEQQVKEGKTEAYGITMSGFPLHQWLEEAAEATQSLYGRRKRPSLRLLHGTLDLLDLSLLTAPVARHKAEAVSPLELAARLGLLTIITAPALPDETPPSAAALSALTQAAEIENTLNHQLGGWPESGGQPLFSILAHLAVGQAPWPAPSHWQAWQAHIWPLLKSQWRLVTAPSQVSLIEAYLQALHKLIPYGESLATAAAQPLLEAVLEPMHARLPAAWRDADPLSLTFGLLSSIPGVTAVTLNQPFSVRSVQQRDDLPDLGALLLQPNATAIIS